MRPLRCAASSVRARLAVAQPQARNAGACPGSGALALDMAPSLSLTLYLRNPLFQQIALYTNRGQELSLRLRRQWQSPQLNKAQRSVMIELITCFIRCQAMAIERMLRLTPNDGTLPVRQLHAHNAANESLRTLHVSCQVLV